MREFNQLLFKHLFGFLKGGLVSLLSLKSGLVAFYNSTNRPIFSRRTNRRQYFFKLKLLNNLISMRKLFNSFKFLKGNPPIRLVKENWYFISFTVLVSLSLISLLISTYLIEFSRVLLPAEKTHPLIIAVLILSIYLLFLAAYKWDKAVREVWKKSFPVRFFIALSLILPALCFKLEQFSEKALLDLLVICQVYSSDNLIATFDFVDEVLAGSGLIYLFLGILASNILNLINQVEPIFWILLIFPFGLPIGLVSLGELLLLSEVRAAMLAPFAVKQTFQTASKIIPPTQNSNDILENAIYSHAYFKDSKLASKGSLEESAVTFLKGSGIVRENNRGELILHKQSFARNNEFINWSHLDGKGSYYFKGLNFDSFSYRNKRPAYYDGYEILSAIRREMEINNPEVISYLNCLNCYYKQTFVDEIPVSQSGMEELAFKFYNFSYNFASYSTNITHLALAPQTYKSGLHIDLIRSFNLTFGDKAVKFNANSELKNQLALLISQKFSINGFIYFNEREGSPIVPAAREGYDVGYVTSENGFKEVDVYSKDASYLFPANIVFENSLPDEKFSGLKNKLKIPNKVIHFHLGGANEGFKSNEDIVKATIFRNIAQLKKENQLKFKELIFTNGIGEGFIVKGG